MKRCYFFSFILGVAIGVLVPDSLSYTDWEFWVLIVSSAVIGNAIYFGLND